MAAARLRVRLRRQPCSRGIVNHRDAADTRLEPVTEGVTVRIGRHRIGRQKVDFKTIRQLIVVRVRIVRIGARGELGAVVQAVIVGVRIIRIGAGENLLSVVPPVAIGVQGAVIEEGIKPEIGFLAVRNAVAVVVAGARTDIEGDSREGKRRPARPACDDKECLWIGRSQRNRHFRAGSRGSGGIHILHAFGREIGEGDLIRPEAGLETGGTGDCLAGNDFAVRRRSDRDEGGGGERNQLAFRRNRGPAGVLPYIARCICQARFEADRLQLPGRQCGAGTERDDRVRGARRGGEGAGEFDIRRHE